MKTVEVKAVSAFHGVSVSQSFRLPAEEGDYYRFCHNPCDNKKKDGIAIHCGCGYPVSRTTWYAPDGWDVCADWANSNWMDCGKNNLVIHLSRTTN